MIFGGIWGGQLQRWVATGSFDPHGSDTDLKRPDAPAIGPRIARLGPDMVHFAEAPREITIVDASGKPLLGGDHDWRFFEASWMHKYKGLYYLSYSTGDTHRIVYATSTSPYGPFTYRGEILEPVQGWTTHHSIVQFDGKWWLFYHDNQMSGKNHLRNVKVTELKYNPDGTIQTIKPLRYKFLCWSASSTANRRHFAGMRSRACQLDAGAEAHDVHAFRRRDGGFGSGR